MVVRFAVSEAGTWNLLGGPWSQAEFGKIRQVERTQQQEGEQQLAAIKLQSMMRAKSARSELVQQLAEHDACLALPGTIQGKSGVYEMYSEPEGASVIARFDIGEGGEWVLVEGPWTKKEWAKRNSKAQEQMQEEQQSRLSRLMGADEQPEEEQPSFVGNTLNNSLESGAATRIQNIQRRKQATSAVGDRRQQRQAATQIQAVFRRKAQRDELVKRIGLESQGGLALPGTIQGASGFYEMWVAASDQVVVVHLVTSEKSGWIKDGGPWTRAEWKNKHALASK
jgi:hypothetical protein